MKVAAISSTRVVALSTRLASAHAERRMLWVPTAISCASVHKDVACVPSAGVCTSVAVKYQFRLNRRLYVVVANMTVAAPLPPHAGMGFLRRLELSSFWNRMCFSACRGALIPVSSHSYSHTVGLLTEMTRRSGVLSGSLGTRLSSRLILRPSSPPPPYPESNWRLRLPPLLPSSEEVHTITFYAGQSLSDHSFILVFVFIACYSSFRRLFATFFFASSMWRMLFETVVLFELSAP